jgi:hypothetical protein
VVDLDLNTVTKDASVLLLPPNEESQLRLSFFGLVFIFRKMLKYHIHPYLQGMDSLDLKDKECGYFEGTSYC